MPQLCFWPGRLAVWENRSLRTRR